MIPGPRWSHRCMAPGGTVHNPNVVKTLLAHDGRALYFVQQFPTSAMSTPPSGITTPPLGPCGDGSGDVLAAWDRLPASPLEDLERLEQLRLIEAAAPSPHSRWNVVGGHCRAAEQPGPWSEPSSASARNAHPVGAPPHRRGHVAPGPAGGSVRTAARVGACHWPRAASTSSGRVVLVRLTFSF